MGRKNIVALIAMVVIIIGVQLLSQWCGKAFYLTQLTMSAYYSLVIVGLCLVMGYAGQISLGHAGFFAIGGYVSAVLTTHNLVQYSDLTLIRFMGKCGLLVAGHDLYGSALLIFQPWCACILAVLLTILIAFAIGIPVLKLKGHYLAMATLGFGTIIYRIALASKVFGEADGISEVPGFTLLPGLEVSGSFSARIANYYIACGILLIGIMLLLNLINSRMGRALRAIHGSDEAAEAMGVNIGRYKLYTFVISAVFAAIAGIFLTHYNGGIGPSEAGIMKSVRYVAIVAVGGMASIWGSLLMGIALNFMSLRGMFGSYDDLVFGSILIGIMLFAPEGILGIHLWKQLKSLCSAGKPPAERPEEEDR